MRQVESLPAHQRIAPRALVLRQLGLSHALSILKRLEAVEQTWQGATTVLQLTKPDAQVITLLDALGIPPPNPCLPYLLAWPPDLHDPARWGRAHFKLSKSS